jgi:START domain
MTTENPATRLRVLRKAVQVLSFGTALVVAILVIAHLVWRYSGSNRWQLVSDEDGIKVYSLKSPGTTLERFRAVTRIKTTLNRVVATMSDSSTEGCRDFDPTCTAGQILEPWDTESRYFVRYFRLDFPSPFTPRDIVMKTQLFQDPRNKSLIVAVSALVDEVPLNPCCVRITHLYNNWRFTPTANGDMEVEFSGDYDFRMPYPLFNRIVPGALHNLLASLEGVFNEEKHQHADFAFVNQP